MKNKTKWARLVGWPFICVNHGAHRHLLNLECISNICVLGNRLVYRFSGQTEDNYFAFDTLSEAERAFLEIQRAIQRSMAPPEFEHSGIVEAIIKGETK